MLNLCAGCLSGGHLAGSYELERVQLHDGGGGGSEVPWHWILGSGFDCGELRLAYRRRPTDQPEESEEVHEDEEEEWEEQEVQATFEDEEMEEEEEEFESMEKKGKTGEKKNMNKEEKIEEMEESMEIQDEEEIESQNKEEEGSQNIEQGKREEKGKKKEKNVRERNEDDQVEMEESQTADYQNKNEEKKEAKRLEGFEDDLVVVILLQKDDKENKELNRLKPFFRNLQQLGDPGQLSLGGLQLSLSKLLPGCGSYFSCCGADQKTTWLVYGRPLLLTSHQLSFLNLK